MRCLLFFPRNKNTKPQSSTGLTLIELLVVVLILAILAGIMLTSHEDVSEQARYDITKFEMVELRKALLQFRRDSNEFPCRIYRSGDYVADITVMSNMDFTSLPLTPTVADYHSWCKNEFSGQIESGLSMLFKFPYDDLDVAFIPLLWNPDTNRGWNGPYLHNQDITDTWGNHFLLLDPELTYGPSYRCKKTLTDDYDVTGNLYSCLTPNDTGWDASTYTKYANIVRLVSTGENGVYDGVNISNPCQPNQDDLVLCLLR
ncbi:MAG: hypothetical protein COA95_11440 [Methylophaga sp.]|nr:MAG: hypothetical protein COA95_11440 [Methylophaga sp.]